MIKVVAENDSCRRRDRKTTDAKKRKSVSRKVIITQTYRLLHWSCTKMRKC